MKIYWLNSRSNLRPITATRKCVDATGSQPVIGGTLDAALQRPIASVAVRDSLFSI